MEEKMSWKKQMMAIPNLLGYLRILMIPLIIWTYLQAETTGAYWLPAVIIGISGITDFLDGQIARRCHMITDLGKVLDPIADKLTQCALVFCLALNYPLMVAVVVIFVVKECTMGLYGLALYKKKQVRLDGAMWCGKICTATLYLEMFLLFLFPQIPHAVAQIMIIVCGGMLIYSFAYYMFVYVKLWKGEGIKQKTVQVSEDK